MPSGLNIIFAGTPDFAAVHLQSLMNSEHNIVGVYTQPDRPAGRGKKLAESPVKMLAKTAGLPVFQPPSLKTEASQTQLASLNADIMVVVAYGLLLPVAVLETPRLGCINVHASILPRWRGAAPIQRAIEAGDSETGVTIMQMDKGLDTGDMLSIQTCPITQHDTAHSLHDKLAEIGPIALVQTLADIQAGTVKPEKQNDSAATYAHKLNKQEAEINWAEPASIIDHRIRAFNPFPGAYSNLNGQRVRILNCAVKDHTHDQTPGTVLAADNGKCILIACGSNTALELTTLQLPGKKAMSSREVLNGSATLFAVGKAFDLPLTS